MAFRDQVLQKWKNNWKAGFEPFADRLAARYKECMNKVGIERMLCIDEVMHETKLERATSKEAILAAVDRITA